MQTYLMIPSLLLLLSAAEGAGDGAMGKAKDLTLIPSLQSGQVVEGKYRGENYRRGWLMNAKVELLGHAALNENLRATVGIAGKTWYNDFPWYRRKVVYNSAMEVPEKYFEFYITHGEGAYRFGNPRRPWLDIGVGVFPFKYNPDVRNLGEYLFRSGTYPGYLITHFDVPYGRLTGLRLSSTLFERFTHHLLLTMETDYRPFHDLTLSYLASWDFADMVEVGGGVSLSRLVSVFENYTHPTTTRDGDPAMENSYVTPKGDTAFYTFRGTKLMARLAVDPKRMFDPDGESAVLGPGDLRLYSEATVLGVKNYPSNNDTLFGRTAVHYDTLWQRIPVMFGLTFPTHPLACWLTFAGLQGASLLDGFFKETLGIPAHPGAAAGGVVLAGGLWWLEKLSDMPLRLDELAFEVEWYGSRFPNSTSRVVTHGYPIPAQPEADYVTYDYSEDDWKWSLYAKKTLADGFSLTMQAARDHYRTVTEFEQQKDREEALTKPKHWYWMMKAEFRL